MLSSGIRKVRSQHSPPLQLSLTRLESRTKKHVK